jgi:hypothetical protein
MIRRRVRGAVRGMRRACAVALLCLGLAGCKAVDFTQQRDLADPVMTLEKDPLEERFRTKATASREGAMAVGGRGSGGCGCY